ncbi:MAG: Rne/Rng family ribonuclease [Planctomycetota bacterium]
MAKKTSSSQKKTSSRKKASDSTSRMVINYVPGEECRVAMVDDGRLEEFHAERANAVSFVGNIYVGKVMNVEASIQAAFIDFGQETNGFLHVSDLHPQYFPGEDKDSTERIGKKTPRRERPPIQQCLKRGQEIIVQVLKEGISTKGPTLTSYLSIPGRFIVMLPDMDRVGVSRKVEDEDQRREMRKVLDGLELPDGFGFIVRTAGIEKSKTELKRDLAYLQRLWKDIERRRSKGKGPRLLYAESDLLMRALRDYWTSDFHEIVIDNEAALKRASRFMRIVSPRTTTKLLRYDRTTPIFHAFGLEEQIQLMHERTVPLPSGGSLVIDEAEALIAIDVNSGKMRRHGDAETTAYKTNVEAVDEICRQLRLRDVGGLVVCDLIDMMKRSNRRDIESRMRERLKRDRAATKPLPISQFGIIEMTRQRMRGSLRSVHFTKCPTCSGRGMLRRPGSAASDALRDLAAMLDQDKVHKVELVVSPRLAGELLSGKRSMLTRLEVQSKKQVTVRVSEDIPVDRFMFYAYDEAGADVTIDRLPKPKIPTALPEYAEHDGAGTDWAVDTLTEHEELELVTHEELEDEHEPLPLLLEGDDEELESAPKKKRRRRRGGRRRGGSRSEDVSKDDAPKQDDVTEESPEKSAAEGEESTEEGGGRKRRRRRRGGRRRRKSGDREETAESTSDAAPDSSASETESGPAEAEQPPVEDEHGLRGDSWDLDPSELAARNGQPAAPAEEETAAAASNAPEDAADEVDPEAAQDKAPARKKTKSKAKTSKKKRSRRSKVTEVSSEDEPEPAASHEEAAPARKKKTTKKAATKKSRSRKKSTSKSEVASDSDAKADPSATSGPTPEVKTTKRRTLYGAQRRKPTISSSQRDRDE